MAPSTTHHAPPPVRALCCVRQPRRCAEPRLPPRACPQWTCLWVRSAQRGCSWWPCWTGHSPRWHECCRARTCSHRACRWGWGVVSSGLVGLLACMGDQTLAKLVLAGTAGSGYSRIRVRVGVRVQQGQGQGQGTAGSGSGSGSGTHGGVLRSRVNDTIRHHSDAKQLNADAFRSCR